MYVCMYVCIYIYVYLYIYICTKGCADAAAGVTTRLFCPDMFKVGCAHGGIKRLTSISLLSLDATRDIPALHSPSA